MNDLFAAVCFFGIRDAGAIRVQADPRLTGLLI
jgi:hypothetical protein